MKKIYLYAFDRRTENLTAALSCPDKWTAFRVLQEAGNSLEINGHGGSLIFDYDVSEGKIEYKPYIRKSWFSKQSEDCYKKIEFDTDDFALAELQTKKSISEVRGRYRHEIRHDVWFMYYANLELQKLANEVRPAKAVESNSPTVAIPTVQSMPTDDCCYPAMTQVASGQGNAKSAIVAYQESIEWTDGPAKVIVKNDAPITTRDSGVAGDVLWALQVSKLPDDKIRHWALSKSGLGYVDIAKSEQPTWEQDYGRERAKEMWASEGETIRMHVRSVENMLAKRKQS